MEKAIEIKRRAQRCIQNGDLDGALSEYEKLVGVEDSDPYNFVLLADLLFKRGDPNNAVQRYLAAINAYEKAALYKNAIAVCKKMMRLALAPAVVLERLGSLHQLDGLATEATLYFVQYAEHLMRDHRPKDAAVALRRAFDACNDEVRVLERLSEVHVAAEETAEAALALAEAAHHYRRLGLADEAERARMRAEKLQPGAVHRFESASQNGDGGHEPSHGRAPDLGMVDLDGSEPPRAGPPPLPLDDADSMATPTTDDGFIRTGPPRLGAAMSDFESTRERVFPAAAAEVDASPPSLMPAADPDPAETGLRFAAPALEAADPFERVEAAAAPAFDTPGPPAFDTAGPPAFEIAGPPSFEIASPPGEDLADAFVAAAAAPDSGAPPQRTLAEIERLLASAQDRFRAGDRDGAGDLLVDAAQAYEDLGKLDNAASIYRSLCRSPQSSRVLMELWLGNCERRDDRREAAEVACELGDRALQDGNTDAAKSWFERACGFDRNNAVAQRRLARLEQMNAAPVAVETVADAGIEAPPAPLPMSPPAAAAAPPVAAPAPFVAPEPAEEGRVEYAVGRGEAVTFDLGSLLSEFQRGIEAQLSGDAQSHYDLAMTYREMGLLEQAVEAFRLAGADAIFAHRSSEMIGRCLLDQGRFEDAAREFAAALQAPDLDSDSGLNLRYQLGLSLEAAGRIKEAMVEFERVFAMQSSYPDVALKLRVLRKSLESA